jgi:hypothetical protein
LNLKPKAIYHDFFALQIEISGTLQAFNAGAFLLSAVIVNSFTGRLVSARFFLTPNSTSPPVRACESVNRCTSPRTTTLPEPRQPLSRQPAPPIHAQHQPNTRTMRPESARWPGIGARSVGN